MFKRKNKLKTQEGVKEKVLDIEAKMEGNLKFNTPTNLRINGSFVGELETKGTLIIGEKADVKAKVIKGENIIIAGKINSNIVSTKCLELSSSAKVTGNIKAPILVVKQGAMLKGHCRVSVEEEKDEPRVSSKKKK